MTTLRSLIVIFIGLLSLNCLGEVSDALLKKAKQGDAVAQLEVAREYLDYDARSYDDVQQGLLWLEKAASQNYTEAMVQYAELLCDIDAFCSEPDFVKAVDLYRKAAAKGDKRAKQVLTDLANMKREEISHNCPFTYLPCDDELTSYSFFKEYEPLIQKEYEKNNPVAAYYIAVISFIEKDYDKTIKLLSEIYPIVTKEDNYFDDFLEDDYNFRANSIGIRVPALLGLCYEFGYGVDKDYKKAAEYYLTDFDYSSFCMTQIPKVRGAYCYKKAGLTDKFIKEAENQGDLIWNNKNTILLKVPCLQNELAEMYRTGEGVDLNKQKALEIYESVVDGRKYVKDLNLWLPEVRSYPDMGNAAYRASKMYLNGEGCEADPAMAELYFEIALKYGNVNAWYENK